MKGNPISSNRNQDNTLKYPTATDSMTYNPREKACRELNVPAGFFTLSQSCQLSSHIYNKGIDFSEYFFYSK